MCQFTKLCFGVPTFRFSLQIVWKILYQASTTANNGLKTMFETLVTWFKLFKHLKHYFFPIALPTFQSTYQNCVRMHKLNAKSPTDSWKVHKTQPFQPQWENLIEGGIPSYFSFQLNFEFRVKLCIDSQSLSLGSGWATNLLAQAE